MRDFWLSSGFHLLERSEAGGLLLTDDFLRAYLHRPEIRPVEESCDDERALHRSLLEEPRRPVSPDEVDRLQDKDARDNYEVMLRFRDRMLRHATIEAAYLSLFREEMRGVPPVFIDQLAHVILRNLLDGCEAPLRLRAAELFFRPQRVSITDKGIMLADEEVVEATAVPSGFASLSSLVADPSPLRTIDIDILEEKTADAYWERSDRFDMALDLSFARPGLDAFCRVLEQWVAHLLGVAVTIQPVQSIRDERWVWHVGLDAEATAIMNALYNGEEVDERRLANVLSLFRLEFRDAKDMLERVAGRPVYLATAMTADNRLRLKPQNLLTNLPVANRELVS